MLVGLKQQIQSLGESEMRWLHIGHPPSSECRLDLATARTPYQRPPALRPHEQQHGCFGAAIAPTSRPMASRWSLFRSWPVPVSSTKRKPDPTPADPSAGHIALDEPHVDAGRLYPVPGSPQGLVDDVDARDQRHASPVRSRRSHSPVPRSSASP